MGDDRDNGKENGSDHIITRYILGLYRKRNIIFYTMFMSSGLAQVQA